MLTTLTGTSVPFQAFAKIVKMTKKAWRLLAIAYLVLYVVAIAVEGHGLVRAPISSPMDKILMAPIGWGFAVYGVQEGYVRGCFSRIDRSESPITFWINISFYFLVGLFFFCWGVRDIFH